MKWPERRRKKPVAKQPMPAPDPAQEPAQEDPRPRELPAASDTLPVVMDAASQFNELMMVYDAAIRQVVTKLEIFNREFQVRNDRNPIESIKSRVKSPDSIAGKLRRKGLDVTLGNMSMYLKDIAGVRVTCPFLSDVYQVADMLLSQTDIRLVEVKDYIKTPKQNGYRSLHLIVQTDVAFSRQRRTIPVEIQFRTIAMNFWASVEHQLRYKKDRALTDEMQQELKACADIIAETDKRMQHMAEQLPYFFGTQSPLTHLGPADDEESSDDPMRPYSY